MNDDSIGPPEEAGVPPSPPPPVRRSPAGAILFGFALMAVLAGGAWFALRLKPAAAPAAADLSTATDTVQIIEPPSKTRPPADITGADLPGFETAGLTKNQLRWLYHRARLEQCGCGCGWNVAECRINDPNCPKSPGRAVELVAEARKQKP